MKGNNSWNKVAYELKNTTLKLLLPHWSVEGFRVVEMWHTIRAVTRALLRISLMTSVSIEFNQVCWRQAVLSNMYSKVSIKHPVLLKDLVWIFPKISIKRPGPSQKKIDPTVLFQGCHGQFLVSIKLPGLDIWKKSLLNDQYYIFFKFEMVL